MRRRLNAALAPLLAICFVPLPRSANAQPADTSAILGAVSANMRVEAARADSADRSNCLSGGASACQKRFPGRPVWYLSGPADSTKIAERLARIDSLPYRVGAAPLPPCPWPATAPESAGFRAEVSLDVHDTTHATVIVYLRCDNPVGYMHDVYQLGREYALARERGTRVVKSVTLRAT